MTKEQLSYEIINDGRGYLIKLDGTPWILQDNYIPYPKATIEESAQAHIEQILIEVNKPPQPSKEDEIAQLKEQVALLESAVAELAYGGAK
ncbi:hypothetical protein RBG61_01930 [Paludicola sp. MB14-C6]|uniref:hypothetical protein n=1 Tax=Paludihabitans sp. MB14-C6 TaxID=3070656 RepID=UPI0027DD4C7F|nr:hypothetical protein [Paludicola sp. MB14-C6]WMJ23450.1 hypothetical protein RBG61_01930 [Paludicola sp. MB14-C6]